MLSFKYIRIRLLLLFIFSILFSCTPKTVETNTRTYRMGFQSSAPRYDFNTLIQCLNMWTQRADAAIISSEVPWDSLYAGVSPVDYVTNNYTGLVNYYRNKQLKLWIYMDPANGMNRAANSDKLITIGKSITQMDAQLKYERFLFVMDSMLQPEHIGFAIETNAIRALAPDSIYQAIKKVANVCATQISNYDKKVIMGISIQADFAWGKLTNSNYIGIDQDFTDFPFIQELGISSYPYFCFNNPQDIPTDYYSRLTIGRNIPCFVSEGGWSSRNVTTTYNTNTQKQSDYIQQQNVLLNNIHANAVFQLTFTDIDITNMPSGTPANLSLFSYIGLIDSALQPKPALATWDNLFALKYTGNK